MSVKFPFKWNLLIFLLNGSIRQLLTQELKVKRNEK